MADDYEDIADIQRRLYAMDAITSTKSSNSSSSNSNKNNNVHQGVNGGGGAYDDVPRSDPRSAASVLSYDDVPHAPRPTTAMLTATAINAYDDVPQINDTTTSNNRRPSSSSAYDGVPSMPLQAKSAATTESQYDDVKTKNSFFKREN